MKGKKLVMEKKRSLKYLIVSVCLALLIASVGGIITGATSELEVDDRLAISGVSLDLDDKVALAFAVEESLVADADLHIYTKNPEGTVAMGTKAYPVDKTVTRDSVKYKLYVTDGFEATTLGETVYARLISKNGASFGPVKKTSVYELAHTLLEALPSSGLSEKQEIRKGLYTAVIDYAESAYLVTTGKTKYPYNWVTVSDGSFIDPDGEVRKQGVITDGSVITVVDEVTEESVGKQIYGWKSGERFFSDSLGYSNITVNAPLALAPVYGDASAYDDNPYVNRNSQNGSGYYNGFNATIAAKWNDIAYTAMSNLLDSNGNIIYSETDKTIPLTCVLSQTDPATGTALGNANDSSIFHIDTDGTMDLQKLHDKLAARALFEDYFHMKNVSVAGANTVASFDFKLPNTDLDCDGVYNEVEDDLYILNTKDDTSGKIDNLVMYKIDINLSDLDNSTFNPITGKVTTVTSLGHKNNVAYLCLTGIRNSDGNIGSWGVEIRTINSNATGNSDKAGSGIHGSFSLDEWHNISVKLVPNSDGTVKALEVWVDGDCILTRNADSAEIDKGLSYNADKGVLKLTGDGAAKDILLTLVDQNRFRGETWFSNFTAYSEADLLTASDIKATAGYSDTYTSNAQGVVTHYVHNSTNDDKRDNIYVNWNTVSSLPGVTEWGNYLTKASAEGNNIYQSWIWSERLDAIILRQFNGSTSGGAISIMENNPLNGKTADTYGGEAVVFEFDVMLLASNMDGDGSWNERNQDFGTTSTNNSGAMRFGISSDENVQSVSGEGGIASIEIRRQNSNGNKAGYWLSYRAKSSPDSYNSQRDSIYIPYSNWATVKVVYVPDASTGAVEKFDFYVNGTLVQSTWAGAEVVNGFSYASDPTFSMFSNKYVGFTWTIKNECWGNLGFRNVKCYTDASYTTPAE